MVQVRRREESCVCVCVCVYVLITLNVFVGVNAGCVSCGEWCRWKGEQHSERLTHDSCMTRASGEWWRVLTPDVFLFFFVFL